jgi:AAA domain-containing protein
MGVNRDYDTLAEALDRENVASALPPLEAYNEYVSVSPNGTNGAKGHDSSVVVSPDTPAPIEATVFVWKDPTTIPPRPWLYGHHYMRGMVSATAGIGGAGKTSLLIVEALCLATGRDWLSRGEPIPIGPQSVWLHNEDPMDELQRRIAATCLQYRILPEDFEGRLHVTSNRTTPIMLGYELPSGGHVLAPTNDGAQIIREIQKFNIALFLVDPFVSIHRVSENDNVMIESVMKTLRDIAEKTQTCIELAHHFRKLNGQEPSADDIRGASSIVGACRSVRVVAQMTADEAQEMDIGADERKGYIWLQNAKANMIPPLLARHWYQLQSVDLNNPEPPYPADSVGVAVPWSPPGKDFDLTAPEFRAVRRAFQNAESPLTCLRYDIRSTGWAGRLMAQALELDPSEPAVKTKVKALIERWIKSKRLRITKADDVRQARTVQILEWVQTGED